MKRDITNINLTFTEILEKKINMQAKLIFVLATLLAISIIINIYFLTLK